MDLLAAITGLALGGTSSRETRHHIKAYERRKKQQSSLVATWRELSFSSEASARSRSSQFSA
jgi:hypothetical protein